MYLKLGLLLVGGSLLVGCASVPMASLEQSNSAKSFDPPANGNAVLYIYRAGVIGGALKKDIWLDGECIGETAPNIFFHEEVKGGMTHRISTESEFSPNAMDVFTESGKNYFVEQYIKLGVFVGGADLKLVSESQGREAVAGLQLARKGSCSK